MRKKTFYFWALQFYLFGGLTIGLNHNKIINADKIIFSVLFIALYFYVIRILLTDKSLNVEL